MLFISPKTKNKPLKGTESNEGKCSNNGEKLFNEVTPE